MASNRGLIDLARDITANVSAVEQFMKSNGLPEASLETDSIIAVDLPPEQLEIRERVLNDLETLHAQLIGPLPYMMRLSTVMGAMLPTFQFIYRFKVAQNLALDETISYETLAQRCNVMTSALRRHLRLATTHHVFREPEKNMIQHNAISSLLIKIPGLYDWIGFSCEEIWPAQFHNVDALQKWPNSEAITHCGWSIRNGDETPFFDAISNDAQRSARFGNGMKMIQSSPALDISFLTDNLGWNQESTPKMMVDVGGSYGSIGCGILAKFPEIQEYVVQDLPDVIQEARTQSGLPPRLRFEEYNFFTEQKLKGADVYYFRQVLHDWPDELAVQILKNQLPALKPGAKIILNDILLPDPGEMGIYNEQFQRGFDFVMMSINNGKERDRDDWAALARKVDSKLKVDSIISPPRSALSIITMVLDS